MRNKANAAKCKNAPTPNRLRVPSFFWFCSWWSPPPGMSSPSHFTFLVKSFPSSQSQLNFHFLQKSFSDFSPLSTSHSVLWPVSFLREGRLCPTHICQVLNDDTVEGPPTGKQWGLSPNQALPHWSCETLEVASPSLSFLICKHVIPLHEMNGSI